MLVYDIESDGLLDTITKVHCVNLIDRSTGREYRFTDHEFYQDEDGKTTTVKCPRDGTIADGLEMLSHAGCTGGQNVIEYDEPALKIVYPDFVLQGTVRDTRVESKLLYPDLKDRDFAAVRKGRLPISFQQKGLIGTHKLESWGLRIGKQLKADFNPKDYGHTWQSMPFTKVMDDYCMDDVRTNVVIFEHFESKPFFIWPAVALESRVSSIIFGQVQNGVHFNEEEAERLAGRIMPRLAEIEGECAAVFKPWYAPDGKFQFGPDNVVSGRGLFVPKRDNGPQGYTAGVPFTKVKQVVFNPGSRDQIASRLQKIYGWKPIETTDGGKPKVDETILEALPYPEAKKLTEFLTLKKRVSQLAEGKQAWIKKVKDGKIHGRVDTLGAVTNRMTHMSPNLAQVPAKGAIYGSECRALFGPRPGWKQVGCDADGLEGRCLGHYLYPYDKGAYIDTILKGDKNAGTDLHSMNMTNVGLPAGCRDGAKTILYAWLYGSGDFNLGFTYINALPEAKRDQFYQQFAAGKTRDAAYVRLGKRTRSRLIEGITGMDKLLKKVHSFVRSGWIKAIDGRRLRIRSRHASLNTLLQGAGAIIMKQGLVHMDDTLRSRFTYGEDWDYLLNVHDEVQIECKPEIAEEVGEIMAASITKAGETLKFNCPLAGSYAVGDNWSQTH